MLNSLTVLGESAKQTCIDLKIAFKWPHCFLGSSATVNINVLSGIVEVAETFFPKSFKGKRYIPHRKARKRQARRKYKERTNRSLIIARDRYGYVIDEILEEFNAECVTRFLDVIIDKESIPSLDVAKCYETFSRKHKLVTIP
ncbi:MAG: hypothetical protein ACTS73_06170 [Arsenophonus sp. NEOnobi-MAG3]